MPNAPRLNRPPHQQRVRYLHIDILIRNNERAQFIPSAHTVDVPLIATATSQKPGWGLVRVFGEGTDALDEEARERMLRLCQFNGRLLLARLHFGLTQGRDDPLAWRRRLQASIGLAGVQQVFPSMPSNLLDGTPQYNMQRVIDWLLHQASIFDAADFVANLERLGARAHLSLFRYLRGAFTPSMPSLHLKIKAGTRHIFIDEERVTVDEAREDLRKYLKRLRKRLRRQGST